MARHRYEQIADELRQGIAEGRWPPGTRLPSTERLVERFQVSRMTIRQAVERLRMDGLVQTRRGAGVFVLESEKDVLPRPRREDDIVNRLITRLDEMEQRVLADLADIRDRQICGIYTRLDAIEARFGDDTGAPPPDTGGEAPRVSG